MSKIISEVEERKTNKILTDKNTHERLLGILYDFLR